MWIWAHLTINHKIWIILFFNVVSPVFQVFGFHLSHLATGEVKHLFTEKFQNDHVVLAKALTGAARSNNVTDKCGPVFWPLLLQDLDTNTSSNMKKGGRHFHCSHQTYTPTSSCYEWLWIPLLSNKPHLY